MNPVARSVLALFIAVVAGTAFAQPPAGRDERRQEGGGGGRMSGEERQRLREDIQRQQADPRRSRDFGGEDRGRRNAEWQRLSPEQREGIRRDMRDYNREFDRRR